MQSTLTKKQFKTFGPVSFQEDGRTLHITATARYDDQCGNGHNSFGLTAEINGPLGWDSCGCLHEDIAKHFPELGKFIKWHLCASDGPMHYISNTLYHAGDSDFNGLKKGEFRQHFSRGQQNNGVPGVPNWVLEFPKDLERDIYSEEKPAAVVVEWKAYGRTGEGKARELDLARSSAVWPDATDEDLTAPGLEDRLKARLPQLLEDFQAAMVELGFTF